ncbi:hypothetical protein CMV_004712 [Castanea mollissima]|uniref:Uncharacterized protein n=1 Tax=Castanea mollissima TaxID=60419 RepID=A0A8J4REE6_9ROSI|nr:hypothetical protein CMV_004712 [Castanea mollissima]
MTLYSLTRIKPSEFPNTLYLILPPSLPHTPAARTPTAAGSVIWRFGFREVEKGDFGLRSFLSPNLQNLQPET